TAQRRRRALAVSACNQRQPLRPHPCGYSRRPDDWTVSYKRLASLVAFVLARPGLASALLLPGLLAGRARVRGRGAGRRPVVLLEADQLPRDPGGAQGVPGLGGQLRGELDQGEVGTDGDRAEVLAAEPALVGDRADDLARLDLVPLAHGDAVRRQRV